MNNIKDKFYLECGCTCSMLVIEKDVDYYFLNYMTAAFSEKQETMRERIWRRIKFAWSILTGGEFRLYDIMIEQDKMAEFKKFVADI